MGGLSPEHTRWVHPPYLFFLPIGVLKRVFRRRFVKALKLAYRHKYILPRGFVRIRQYGFLANRCRAANLALGRQLLAITPKPPEACPNSATDAPTWRCPQCGAAMQIGANLTARQLAQQCKFFDSS